MVTAAGEARVGCYAAADTFAAMKKIFTKAVTKGTTNALPQADSEWQGILAWAVGHPLNLTGEQITNIRDGIAERFTTPTEADELGGQIRVARSFADEYHHRVKYAHGVGWPVWGGCRFSEDASEAYVAQLGRLAGSPADRPCSRIDWCTAASRRSSASMVSKSRTPSA